MRKKTEARVDERLRHIAFIMDGNGRWANKRGMPREYGHRFGVKAFRAILDHCNKLSIRICTFYAFSTENWKRPEKEVSAIMKLMSAYLEECEEKIDKYDFSIRFLGAKSAFDPALQERMDRLERESAGREKIVNIALNYGARAEIVTACNRLLQSGKGEVTEQDFANVLYTAGEPDPDLIIRTGGDYRISNFLLWQAAYAELYFTDTLWPDFDKAALDAAIEEFYSRKRRYGGV